MSDSGSINVQQFTLKPIFANQNFLQQVVETKCQKMQKNE